MAIEVKIPTILRTYTGGEKSVEAKGDTLAALSDRVTSVSTLTDDAVRELFLKL